MINPQHTGNDSFDVLQGSVTNHFAKIESVLLQNECINGQYNLVTAASYGANTPVATPGFTRVCISTNGSIIADLENSYIEANLKYKLRYSGAAFTDAKLPNADKSAVVGDTKLARFFIGFKQSLDALERYDLYVNSQQIYSQPFVGPESTIMLAGLNDTIRENNPWVYTSYKNACTMDQNVCGVYVDLSNVAADTEFEVDIPVKINLHQFLLLSPIHYLPSFAGRWEIQLHFGPKNLVITPVLPTVYYDAGKVLDKYKLDANSKLTINGAEVKADADVLVRPVKDRLEEIMHHCVKDTDNAHMIGWANYFTQLGCPLPVYTGVDQNKLVFKKITFECTESVLSTCLMNTTQFQLRYEVYQALMSHYVENPLIIPTNTLSYNRFSHSSGSHGGNSFIQATANLPVENIDSIFVLVPENERQQTCFYQPHLTAVRLGMGEFGIHPQRYMDTYNTKENAFNNRRFVSYLLDSLNLENSQISAMNKDFSNSILPFPIVYSGANLGNKEYIRVAKNYTDKCYDSSHFIIGFPCSQVGFQSGTVSSPNSNINFQFDATCNAAPDCDVPVEYKTSVICMFLADCELMIQVVPNSDLPIVRLSSKSIV